MCVASFEWNLVSRKNSTDVECIGCAQNYRGFLRRSVDRHGWDGWTRVLLQAGVMRLRKGQLLCGGPLNRAHWLILFAGGLGCVWSGCCLVCGCCWWAVWALRLLERSRGHRPRPRRSSRRRRTSRVYAAPGEAGAGDRVFAETGSAGVCGDGLGDFAADSAACAGGCGLDARCCGESERQPVGAGVCVCLLLLAITTVLGLPLDMYGHHVSMAYGMSVQGWGSWFGDMAKSFGLTLAVGGLLVMLLFWVMKKSPARVVVLVLDSGDGGGGIRGVRISDLCRSAVQQV